MNSASLFTEICDTFKRKLWLPALAAVALLFAMPVYLGLTLQRFINWSGEFSDGYYNGINNALQGTFSLHSTPTIIICVIGALVTGLVFTNYLRHRQQVDFYHALPIKRGRLLAVNFGAALLTGVVPLLLNTLLALLLVLLTGFGSYLNWGEMLGGFGVHILFYTAMLVVVFVAAMLSGNSACTGLLSLVFFGLGVGLLGLWNGIGELFYPTWNSQLINWNMLISHSSPVARYIALAINEARYALTAFDVLATLAFILLMYALALILYRRRPAEAAGNALVFRASKQWLKWPIVLLASGGLALLLSLVSGNEGGIWYFIGLFLGAAISAQVMEVIDAYDFRAVRKGLLPLLLFIALFGGGSLLMKADITHYNDYVPAPDEVAAVEILFTDINNYAWQERSRGYYERDAAAPQAFLKHGLERHLAQAHIEDDAAIAAALEVVTPLAESYRLRGVARADAELAAMAHNGGDGLYVDSGCIVRYTLANGRQVDRRYTNGYAEIEQLLPQLTAIYAADGYQRAQHELFDYDPAQIRLTEIRAYESVSRDYNDYAGAIGLSYDELVNIEPARLQAVLEAYERELCAFEPQQQADSMPVGILTFSVFAEPPAAGLILTEQNRYEHYSIFYEYPLYPEFTATIAALAEAGLDEALWRIDYDSISYVMVYDYLRSPDAAAQDVAAMEYYGKYDAQPLTSRYQEAEDIRRLMDNSHDQDAYYYNSLAGYQTGIDLLVCYHDDSGGEYTFYRQFVTGFEP